MDFKTAMEHYKTGTASEEERRIVEEELEKSQLIAEYWDTQWNDAPNAVDTPPEEMKRVRNSLHRRNASTILISLVLAAAMLFGTVQYILPWLEQQYWDPNTISFATEHATDFDMTLDAYAELFCPEMLVISSDSMRTGFASYSTNLRIQSNLTGDWSYAQISLQKGKLSVPLDFWDTVPEYAFNKSYGEPYDTLAMEQQYQTLSQLPEYITVTASVSFAEDISVETLLYFYFSIRSLGGTVNWAAVRHTDEISSSDTLCGMSLSRPGQDFDGINDYYPCFNMRLTQNTADNLEQHFKSLLRYSRDQYLNGTGIEPPASPDYYDSILSYVEENGVSCFGCYVTAPAELLLMMQEWKWISISRIQLLEAWIDI